MIGDNPCLRGEEGTGDHVGGEPYAPPPGEAFTQLSPTEVCRTMDPLLNGMSHFARKCKNPDYDVKSLNFYGVNSEKILTSCEFNITPSGVSVGYLCVSLAGPEPAGHGKSGSGPQETEMAFEVTAFPSPTTPPSQQRSRAGMEGVAKAPQRSLTK